MQSLLPTLSTLCIDSVFLVNSSVSAIQIYTADQDEMLFTSFCWAVGTKGSAMQLSMAFGYTSCGKDINSSPGQTLGRTLFKLVKIFS